MDGTPVAPLTRRAGFWVRAVACGLDACVAGIVSMVISAAPVFLAETFTGPDWMGEQLAAILLSVVVLGYSSFEVFKAATPGKMILGLVIATPRGAPADRWTLALRWSTKQAPLLLALAHVLTLDVLSQFLASLMNTIVLAGCLQALDEHKRAWHDEWAGTAVFHRPRAAPAPPAPYLPAGPPPLSVGAARSEG